MPLGERAGHKESRYCGVEAEFNDDIPQLLAYNISSGGFDFVVAPLVRATIVASYHFLLYLLILLEMFIIIEIVVHFGYSSAIALNTQMKVICNVYSVELVYIWVSALNLYL